MVISRRLQSRFNLINMTFPQVLREGGEGGGRGGRGRQEKQDEERAGVRVCVYIIIHL